MEVCQIILQILLIVDVQWWNICGWLGNLIQKCTKGKQYALTLCWIAGHVGIPSNELADWEAKCAAGGITSDKSSLPPYLKRMLTTNLINPSAITRLNNSEIKKRWMKSWKRSHRGIKMAKIDAHTPLAHFLLRLGFIFVTHASSWHHFLIMCTTGPPSCFILDYFGLSRYLDI